MHPRQTRSKTAASVVLAINKRNIAKCDIFSIILQQDILHWSDGVALGATCKDARSLWKGNGTEGKHCLPLLKVLERLVGRGNTEEYDSGRREILRAVLLDKAYPSFSVTRKCQAMVALLQTVVGNMQSHGNRFCLEDPSNPAKNTECNISGWCMGPGYKLEEDFLHEHDRRSALALNIAIFSFALSAMEYGGDYYFNDVLLGKPGAYLGGDSCYGVNICEHLMEMLPLCDEDLVKHMRAAYPSSKTLEILGPVLTPKVVLMAPFFRWLPPTTSNGDSGDGIAICLGDLPTPLEPMDEAIVRSWGMERWLD